MAESKKKHNVATVVSELIVGKVEELGYMLWDVEFVKEGSDYYLRITIDSEEGISIDDCEAVHNAIDPMLDEADPIPDAYHLEVSSPGIERELRVPAHFTAMIGAEVEVKLYQAFEGKKRYVGTLADFDEEKDEMVIALDEGEMTVKRGEAAKVTTLFDFGDN